jgi:hypothetical protein
MVRLPDIVALVKPRIHKLLLVAEAALPEGQFAAFRKIVLDELGNSGLNKDLEELFGKGQDHKDRSGTGRNTLAGKEVDHD